MPVVEEHDGNSADDRQHEARRTLLHLHLDDSDTRVVELLWREYDGRWLVEDARIFSLLPGE